MGLPGSLIPVRNIGELAEWLMAAVLKTVDPNGFGGSNPSLSAKKKGIRAKLA